MSYGQLHQFVAAGLWDAGFLEAAPLAEADRLAGGKEASLVVDNTALPKKGRHSVGIAAQYPIVVGRKPNCQTLVLLTLARREAPAVVSSKFIRLLSARSSFCP